MTYVLGRIITKSYLKHCHLYVAKCISTSTVELREQKYFNSCVLHTVVPLEIKCFFLVRLDLRRLLTVEKS